MPDGEVFPSPPVSPTPPAPSHVEGSDGWGAAVGKFLRANWPVAVVLLILVAVIIWAVATGQTGRLTGRREVSQPAPTVTTAEAKPPAEEKAPGVLDFLKRKPGQREEEKAQAQQNQVTQPTGEIKVKAERGEGVTHLARRALKQFLEENKTGENLTKEHKIYIEDWLKDKKGARPLKLGEELSFSKEDIQAAIDASLNLKPKQLESLKFWSARVTTL